MTRLSRVCEVHFFSHSDFVRNDINNLFTSNLDRAIEGILDAIRVGLLDHNSEVVGATGVVHAVWLQSESV